MQTQGIKLLGFWQRGRAHVRGLLGSCKKPRWGLPYLSLLQHQKNEQYYKHDLISNFKAFLMAIILLCLMRVRVNASENNQTSICYRQKHALFLLAISSRRFNIGKDNFRIIYPRRWHPPDSGSHNFVYFWRTLSDISTSKRYVIPNSICSFQ